MVQSNIEKACLYIYIYNINTIGVWRFEPST